MDSGEVRCECDATRHSATRGESEREGRDQREGEGGRTERERERQRERVWAPGTVVIVVNLTTVKAVTACPYRPVYAAES